LTILLVNGHSVLPIHPPSENTLSGSHDVHWLADGPQHYLHSISHCSQVYVGNIDVTILGFSYKYWPSLHLSVHCLL